MTLGFKCLFLGVLIAEASLSFWYAWALHRVGYPKCRILFRLYAVVFVLRVLVLSALLLVMGPGEDPASFIGAYIILGGSNGLILLPSWLRMGCDVLTGRFAAMHGLSQNACKEARSNDAKP